ncbi:EpsG family protein [Jeotgalibacillus soli]|uniref:Capsular polysaccharide biosynthesis protein n=1 Tax=Jeotgalibacillus soli TaxID=889306 RepID=A0A0C2RGP8_9BACL|nr:EpsG family protein [Jeotgalibacillus soli]KIL49350.1 capsular polysaccharide biosynthesis protein [Jeotgalibacillus soli]
MAILWMNLALVFIFSFFARYASTSAVTTVGAAPYTTIKPNRLLMLGAMAVLVLVSGLRSNIGDTFNYRNIYVDNEFTWEYVLGEKDIGFGILQMLLKQLSADPQIMIFTSALITNVLIVFVLYKYSRMFELSLFVYITGGLFLVSMNGIRQTLAAAIAFTALKYLIDGSWKKYMLAVIFASLFHQSALVLIPIYFIVRFKAWSKATVALVLLSIVIVIGFEQFSSVLFSAIEDTQYGAYKEFDEGGASTIRVAVTAVPLLIAYLGREKLKRIFPLSDIIVNLALLNLVFMIVSTQSWIFARFSIYFGLYQLILISWVVKLFREKDQKFVYFGIIVCYLFYYYYESVVSLGILYKSNYLIW